MDTEKIVDRIKKNCMELFHTDETPTIRKLSSINMPETTLIRLQITFRENTHNIFVKEYRPSERVKGVVNTRLEREYNALKVLRKKCKGLSHVPVVKPVGCFSDLGVLLTEEISGEPLNKIIKSNARGVVTQTKLEQLRLYCRMSGKWLASLQEISKNLTIAPYNVNTALDEIYDLTMKRTKDLLISETLAERICLALNEIRTQVPEKIPLSGMHSDFIPSNIVASQENIVMLDFECFRNGPIYRDVITFIQFLDNYLINPFFRKRTIQTLQKEFLKGYGRTVNNKDVPLVRMLSIKETLGQFTNWLSPNWNVLGIWAKRRAKCRLERRLEEILTNRTKVEGCYLICGIPWKVV